MIIIDARALCHPLYSCHGLPPSPSLSFSRIYMTYTLSIYGDADFSSVSELWSLRLQGVHGNEFLQQYGYRDIISLCIFHFHKCMVRWIYIYFSLYMGNLWSAPQIRSLKYLECFGFIKSYKHST